MNLSEEFVVSDTNHLFDSVVESCEDCKDSSHGKNVMEVSNNVVSIVKGDVESGIREDDSGDTSDGEEEDETKGEE